MRGGERQGKGGREMGRERKEVGGRWENVKHGERDEQQRRCPTFCRRLGLVPE